MQELTDLPLVATMTIPYDRYTHNVIETELEVTLGLSTAWSRAKYSSKRLHKSSLIEPELILTPSKGVSSAGIELINAFLTYNPKRRIDSASALEVFNRCRNAHRHACKLSYACTACVLQRVPARQSPRSHAVLPHSAHQVRSRCSHEM